VAGRPIPVVTSVKQSSAASLRGSRPRLRSSTETPIQIDNKLTVPTISSAASPRQVVELAVSIHITCDGSVVQILGPQSTHHTQNQLVPA
jgi:hypothetical protein